VVWSPIYPEQESPWLVGISDNKNHVEQMASCPGFTLSSQDMFGHVFLSIENAVVLAAHIANGFDDDVFAIIISDCAQP